MNKEDKKVMVTEDALLKFLGQHRVKLIRLSELTGIKEAAINSCFHHHKNNNGVPRHFNRDQVSRINKALPQLAMQLRGLILKYDEQRAEQNTRGIAYDRGLVEPMKKIGELLNLTALCERVLGWSKKKKDSILVTRVSKAWGNITAADAAAVNTELLAIAGVLEGYELVVNDNNEDSSMEDEKINRPQESENKTQTYPWENRKINLSERSRLFKKVYPNGMLLFRVNGGYAVEGEDVNYVYGIDNNIHPSTDPVTNVTTAFISDDSLVNILPRFIAQGKRVIFTDL